MRHRLSNLAHRFGHWVDPAAQPLCACRAASFIEGIKARRPSSPVAQPVHDHVWVWHHDWFGAHVCECGAVQETRPEPVAHSPEELRELIAASERGVE